MSEHISFPFLAYNSTGNVKTLVGNWQEEECLKAVTGCSRTQAVTLQHQQADPTVFAARQDAAVQEATHTRVIEHTEQLLPSEWLTSSKVVYQNPQYHSNNTARYANNKHKGPREQQEAERLWLEAAAEQPAILRPAKLETTSAASFQAHCLEGLHVGARVMKTQDGAPVQRDPTFLAEMQIVPKAAADRLMGGSVANSSSYSLVASSTVCAPGATAPCLEASSVPVTIYQEAAAKSTYNGLFHGTTTFNKLAPMNRNDNFTKLMSDYNKCTDDQ